jgi:hypothetical protein
MQNLRNSTAVIERFVDLPGGEGFSWVKTQNVESVVDDVKRYSEASTLAQRGTSARRMIGSVPNLIGLEWSKEWGVPLYSKEWMEKARSRILHDPNWKKLRVEHQK